MGIIKKPEVKIDKALKDRAKEVGVILKGDDPGIGLDNLNLTASFGKWSVTVNVDKGTYRFDEIGVWINVLKLLLATLQNDGGQEKHMDMIQGLMLTESN